jgi:hypothetical protein
MMSFVIHISLRSGERVFSHFNPRSYLLVFQQREGIPAFLESWAVQEDEEDYEQLYHLQIEGQYWLLGRIGLDHGQFLSVADGHQTEAM